MKGSRFKYFLPTLGESWILVAVLVLFGALFSAAPKMIASYMTSEPTIFDLESVSYVLMMLPLFLWMYFMANMSWRRKEVSIKLNAPDFGKMNPILFFVVIGACVFPLGILTEPLTSFIPMPDSIKAIFEKAFYGSNTLDTFVSACLLAPLCEEFLCRGIILRGLLTRMSPVKAICWSAAIFAIIHLNPWQAIPAFVLGCFFGWIYYRTRSIWATIFLHFVNNGFAIISSKLYSDVDVDESLIDILPSSIYIPLYVASLVIVIVLIFIIKKYTSKNEKIIST
ncbi:MAG: CPBP family intramembrane metalloprotease [Bacteroidales bacterium]|nr:CPBP family intramembrane metalloprotease [Bacteroidales bacterium]